MCFFGVVRNLLLIVASLALLAGCSISYSSGKSSDSSTSSFSSGGGECEKADKEISSYVEDVVSATDLYVSRGKSSQEFQRQITDIAAHHRITDWENEASTFVAMGKGLKRAGVNEESFADLPYFATVAVGPKYALLLKGYKD